MDLSRYIGLPYRSLGRERDGLDCWGLLRLVYREQMGVDLPSYTGEYMDAAEAEEVAALVGRVMQSKSWRLVQMPAVGDAVLCRGSGSAEPSHVGVYAGRQQMLHIQVGSSASLARLDSPRWSRRVEGFYRCRQST